MQGFNVGDWDRTISVKILNNKDFKNPASESKLGFFMSVVRGVGVV